MTQTQEHTQDPKPGFSIGIGNWLWGAFCALVASGLMTLRDGAPGGYISVLLGAAIATFVMAALVAWIAWRVGGRKAKGGRVAFAVVCLLTMLGQFTAFGDVANENQAIGAIQGLQQRYNAKLMQALADPALESRMVPAKLRELDALLSDASWDTAKHKAPALASALSLQLHANAENELAYGGSMGDFLHAKVLEFDNLQTGDDIRRRRVACKNLIEATATYEKWTQTMIDGLEKRIADAHVSARLQRNFMEGARSVREKRRAMLESLLTLRKGYAATLIEMFDALAEHGSEWKIGSDGKIVFTTDEAEQAFQAQARKVDSMSEEMGKLEAQLQKAINMPKEETKTAGQLTL